MQGGCDRLLVTDRRHLAAIRDGAPRDAETLGRGCARWIALSGSPGTPDRIVFDLDPGDGAGLRECADTAALIRTVLVGMGLDPVPVTSGGNGIHVYATLDGRRSSTQITDIGHELARSLEADHPDLIVSNLSRARRRGKVLIDWSQNTATKTTITPYSLRGRERPTVAMPRLWEEITSPNLRQIEMDEVFELLRHRGDAARALQTPRTAALDAYRSKRDPARTPEPMPPAAPGGTHRSGRQILRHPQACGPTPTLRPARGASRCPGQLGAPERRPRSR